MVPVTYRSANPLADPEEQKAPPAPKPDLPLRPPSRSPPSDLAAETPAKRQQSTSVRGQPQPQKAIKFTVTPQTVGPSRCPERVSDFAPSSKPQENKRLPIRVRSPKVLWDWHQTKADISMQKHTLGVFFKHTLKCTIKPMEMAAHRDAVTELKSRPSTEHDKSGCPVHAGGEGGLIARGSSLHPAPGPCHAQRLRVEVGIGARILRAV